MKNTPAACSATGVSVYSSFIAAAAAAAFTASGAGFALFPV